MFTTVPDVVWGDNFNIIPAGIIPNITPESNCLSRKGRVITDIEFNLACKSTCFSMMDSIDGIISLCFTEAGIDDEFHFNFGEKYEDVVKRLELHDLELIEIEAVKFDDNSIIDDVVKQLEDENDDNIDDIW
jgi:hypothetical protein